MEIELQNLYVGELFVTDEEEAKKLIRHGAIDMDKRRVKAVRNTRTGERFHPVFTMFVRTLDGFISMHNGKKYTSLNFDEDCCFHIKPIKNYLPQTDEFIHASNMQHLSTNKALWLFNTLFQDWKRYPLQKLYTKEVTFPTKDLFIGDIKLYEGCHSINNLLVYTFASLPEMLMLEKSGAKFIENRFKNRISENGSFGGTDVWAIYESLFRSQQNGQFYNLHNHQTYECDNDECFSNCTSLYPFSDYLDRAHIPYDTTISIPDALKKYRKLKK